MSYNLFIDDERDPPNDGRKWIVARTYRDVKLTIFSRGMPSYISFDHDLGDMSGDGYKIAKKIVSLDMEGWKMPDDFDFYVHSQNPIGKANIEHYLRNYLDYRRTNKT